MTNSEIIKGCKAGNKLAYKALVDKHASWLMAVCLRYMKQETDAKDVLQEVYIKIFNAMKNYEENGSFEGWLKRIAVNTCLNQLRQSAKIIELNVLHHSPVIFEEVDVLAKLSAEEILEKINKIADPYRIVFLLHVVEG